MGEGCRSLALSLLNVGRGGNLVNLSPIDDPASPGNEGNRVNPQAESLSSLISSCSLSTFLGLILNLTLVALGRNTRFTSSSPSELRVCFQAQESNWELVTDSMLDVESILLAFGRSSTCSAMVCSACSKSLCSFSKSRLSLAANFRWTSSFSLDSLKARSRRMRRSSDSCWIV